MGICCKNSTWCNGIAYAKISHKPLQSLSEVHLVLEYLIHFSSLFNAFLPLHTQQQRSCHSYSVTMFRIVTFCDIFFFTCFEIIIKFYFTHTHRYIDACLCVLIRVCLSVFGLLSQKHIQASLHLSNSYCATVLLNATMKICLSPL